MFTRIDHVMICVPDLPQGIAQYHKMGFNIFVGGVHSGKGTHNAIALNCRADGANEAPRVFRANAPSRVHVRLRRHPHQRRQPPLSDPERHDLEPDQR